MTDTPGQAPPGWYPDPSGAPRQRYFDGEIWTDHFHDDGAPIPAAASSGGYVEQTSRVIGLTDPGTLLGDAWAAVKARIGQLLGVTVGFVVAIAIVYALFFAWLLSRLDSVDDFNDFGDSIASFIVAYILMAFVVGLIYAVYGLMVARLMHLEHRGQHVSLDAAWTKTKQRLWAFFGTSIALYIGVYIGLFVLTLTLAQIAPAAALLVLVPMAFAWVKLAFLPIAAVATSPGDSMVSASTSVSAGRFWPVFGRMLMVALPIVATYAVTFVIIIASRNAASDAVGLLLVVVVFVGGLLGGLIMASGLTKLYLDSGAPSDV